MKLDVPYFKQDTVYTCGAASLQMALAFFGYYESESRIAKEARTEPKEGTTRKWMIRIATKKGFYCYANNNSSLNEIQYFLSMELPIIVRFTEHSEDVDHYSIITGLKKGIITMNDPWNGENFEMTAEEFERRWHSEDNDHLRWLMVISKEKFNIGRQHFPQK